MFRLLLRLPSLFELKFLTHYFLGPAIVPVRREFIARSIRIGLRGEPALSAREGRIRRMAGSRRSREV